MDNENDFVMIEEETYKGSTPSPSEVSVTKENTPGQDISNDHSDTRLMGTGYLPYDTTSTPKTYCQFIEDFRTGPGTKTYEINGIHFFIKNGRKVKPCEEVDWIKNKMMENGRCRVCGSRATKFFHLVGPNGSAFLDNVKHPNDGCEKGSLFNLRETAYVHHQDIQDPEIFIVDKDTFPGVENGIDKETGKAFEHITIKPDKVTDEDKSKKFKRFLEVEVPVCQTRLSNLFNKEAINSMKIIFDNVHKLTRPGHWTSVIRWYTEAKKLFDKPYEDLTSIEQIQLAVFSLTSGRIDCDETTCVNKDFRQSSNLVDFATMGSIEAILREMDTRSDPANYMHSQLERSLAKHSVTSKYRISLVWDGKAHKDDLDLDVLWNYTTLVNKEKTVRVYYGNKVESVKDPTRGNYTTRLDFDANAGKKIDEPAENISCVPYGSYVIRVNNYTRFTRDKDIPFTVIIHQEGKEDIIMERVWPKDRACHSFMEMCVHSFTEVQNPELKMSSKAAARSIANKGEWDEYFGQNITSFVPNALSGAFGEDVPVTNWNKPKEGLVMGDQSFMEMAQAKMNQKEPSSGKKYLSEVVLPQTMVDLMEYMSNGEHTLQVKPRGKCPGYVTKINTAKEVQKHKYSLNHFRMKGELPEKPSESGTARFDSSWFVGGVIPSYATVRCAVQFEKNWFLVIENTCLSKNSVDYPLAGGFHTGALKPSLHSNHNYQWTFCNTKILPTASNICPLIGTFLVADEVELILDGKPTIVKTK